MESGDGNGLLWALHFDGAGSARPLTWSDLPSWEPAQGPLWLHMDLTREAVQEWIGENLSERVGLHPGIDDALLAEETRPRCEQLGHALVLVLRGVNRNEGEEPADMVSIRLYVDATRIVSLRRDRIVAAHEIANALEQGVGPFDSGSFLVHLIECILEPIGMLVEELALDLDDVEERVLAGEDRETQRDLADLRRRTVQVRRHIAPEREALVRLSQEPLRWVQGEQQADLRQLADRLTRYLEDLDEVRERAAVTQDELASHAQQQLNRRILRLSLVAAVFLPLNLVTGMFGMNLPDIPFANTPSGFAIVVGGILVLGVLEVLILRRMSWS